MAIAMELLGAERLRRNLSTLEIQVFPTANARALNKAGARMRTASVRAVSKAMGLKQKDVRSRVDFRKATESKQNATLEFEGRALNLIRFRARQTRKGVKASPWGKARTYPRSFVAKINGTEVVMIRQERGGKMVPRLPIRGMLGPGIAKTANEPELQAIREDVMRNEYGPELARQLEMLVKRLPSR